MNIISVIVTYNGLNWIRKCVECIMSGTYNSSIIIVDNNSSDGTIAFLELNFPTVTVIKLKKNIGFGAANNIGIKKAYNEGADYVFLLNQDAYVRDDTIEGLVNAQQKQSEFGVVSPMHLNGTGTALDYKFSIYIAPDKCKNLYSDIYLNYVSDKIYEADFVNAAAWLISRQCIETVGGFSPSFFHYGEDDNYLQRVKYHNLKIGICAKYSVRHDRENRGGTLYFGKNLEGFKRYITLQMSNPNLESQLFNFKMRSCFKMVKASLTLNFKLLKTEFARFKLLLNLNENELRQNRNESRSRGLTYLK